MDGKYQLLCNWLVEYAKYDELNDHYSSIAASTIIHNILKANIQQPLKGVFHIKQGRNIILRYNLKDHTFETGKHYDEFIKKIFLD